MRSAAAALLIAVLAFALRDAWADAYRAPEGDASAPAWLIDDPDAAYHLRRVQVALRAGDVPATDSFLSHPTGSAVPWPPLFDQFLVLVAELTGASESDAAVEARLVRLPPLLGALAVLAVFAAVRALAGGRDLAAAVGALVAALVYAVLPPAVWYGGVGRIDHHVFVALLLALELACVAWALRADKPFDVLLGAATAGALQGAMLLAWLGAAPFAAALALGFLVRALASDPDRAASGARGGLVYFATAALVVWLPASASPWNELEPGSLVNLTAGVPRGLLLGALPFVLLGLPRLRGRHPGMRLAAATSVTAIVAALLPDFLEGAREGLEWASRGELFMDVVQESRPLLGGEVGLDPALLTRELTWLALAFPLAWLAVGWRSLSAERWALLALAGLLAAMALQQRRFANSFAAPYAATLGLALVDLLRVERLRRAGLAVAALALLPLGLAAWGQWSLPEAELAAVRRWRAEVVVGLRWMRRNTPEVEWTRADERQAYAVLSAWGLGHLIEYHARRPTITTNFGSYVGEAPFAAAHRALLEADPEAFATQLRQMGARYVVVTPRQAGDIKSLARIAGRGGEGWLRGDMRKARATALWRLALTPPDVAREHYPGLELVWSARRREATSGAAPEPGELSGPALSIYRLVLPEGQPTFSSD